MAAAGQSRPFPWAEVMSIGLGRLRLAPSVFWSMTPREFERACAPLAPACAGPPTRGELDAMMKLFPDKDLR